MIRTHKYSKNTSIIKKNTKKSILKKTNNTINFDDVKIKNKLGSGLFGTTYLALLNNKEYALKIQHILEKDKNKDFKNELWRELDLYNFINTLNKKDQLFFNKLYDYKIYDNCTHLQERAFVLDHDKQLLDKINKIEKSKLCIKYLIDYGGKINLHDFLINNKIMVKQVLSILLQICKMILILYNNGYSHNDLHLGNIMIKNTDEKYFNFMNKKIPYNGYQLMLIDYGLVLHKKYGIKYKNFSKLFLTDRTKYMFNEIYNGTFNVISNSSKNIDDCEKAKKLKPWEHKINTYDDYSIIKQIILNHSNFYTMTKHKYLKIYPNTEKLLNYIESEIKNNKNKIDIIEFVKNKKNKNDFYDILNRIEMEFNLCFTDKYAKYVKWCSYPEFLLPKDIVLNLLIINNYTDYINYLISQCLE